PGSSTVTGAGSGGCPGAFAVSLLVALCGGLGDAPVVAQPGVLTAQTGTDAVLRQAGGTCDCRQDTEGVRASTDKVAHGLHRRRAGKAALVCRGAFHRRRYPDELPDRACHRPRRWSRVAKPAAF